MAKVDVNPEAHSRARAAAKLGAVCALGVALAGGSYLRYASVWLRKPPPIPRCVGGASMRLAKPTAVSGDAPHESATGETVYLTEAEDDAVRCAYGVSPALARWLTSALAEPDPDRRAALLVALVGEHTPRDAKSDREAYAAFRLAYGALQALPRTDTVIASDYALLELNGCRFATADRCPARPPRPLVVGLVGTPSAIGLVAALGYAVMAGAKRAIAWLRRRRAARKIERK